MHLSIVGPTISPGAVGGDLTKQVIKYPTIWAGQVIKSPTLGAHLPFKTESNPLVFPTCSPGGDSKTNY